MYWVTLFSALIFIYCCVWLIATVLMNENEYNIISSIRWCHFATATYHMALFCVPDKRNDCWCWQCGVIRCFLCRSAAFDPWRSRVACSSTFAAFHSRRSCFRARRRQIGVGHATAARFPAGCMDPPGGLRAHGRRRPVVESVPE